MASAASVAVAPSRAADEARAQRDPSGEHARQEHGRERRRRLARHARSRRDHRRAPDDIRELDRHHRDDVAARRSRTPAAATAIPSAAARRPALGRPPAPPGARAAPIGTSSTACHPSADAAIAAIRTRREQGGQQRPGVRAGEAGLGHDATRAGEHEVERHQHRARPEADGARAGEGHRERAADHDRDPAGHDEARGEDPRVPPAEAPLDRVGRRPGGHHPDREQRRVQRGGRGRDVQLVAAGTASARRSRTGGTRRTHR